MLKIRNWERFQHYKHRNPPWVRLYVEILEQFDEAGQPKKFFSISDQAKLTFLALVCLASRYGGVIPSDDTEWLKLQTGLQTIELASLVDAGFIIRIDDASKPLADCMQAASRVCLSESCTCTETSTEAEAENTTPARPHEGTPDEPDEPLYFHRGRIADPMNKRDWFRSEFEGCTGKPLKWNDAESKFLDLADQITDMAGASKAMQELSAEKGGVTYYKLQRLLEQRHCLRGSKAPTAPTAPVTPQLSAEELAESKAARAKVMAHLKPGGGAA